MTQYSEREIWYPALALLEDSPAGLTTSDLIEQLTERLRPDGHDAEILANRSDTHFSQTVRNLIGLHRALEHAGYLTYVGANLPVQITDAGRRALAGARRSGEWPGFGPTPPASEESARAALWAQLLAAGGPLGVAPQLLHDLRIYRGARGIWVDSETTAARDPDSEAVHGVGAAYRPGVPG